MHPEPGPGGILFWSVSGLKSLQTVGQDVPSSGGKSTAALVTRGAALFMAIRWGVRAIGLVSTMVLARLLVPADFGLVAIATSLIAILNTVTELGARSATIRQEKVSQEFLDTVLTLQLLRGLVIAALVLTSSLVLPGMMKDARLGMVLLCLALEPLISAFVNPRMALFEGKLNFGPEAILQISAKILSTVLTIAIALWQRSYWALIAGTLIASSAKVLISSALAPAWPRVGLSAWGELFRFSGWVTLASLFDSLASGFDQLIVGGFLNVRTAGLYNVGAALAAMPLYEFLPVVNRALMPGLVKFKHDVNKMRQVSLDVTGFLAGLSLPVGVGFCFVAPEFVHLFYGDKWNEAVPIVQVLSVGAALGSIGGAVATATALALGRTDLMFQRALYTVLLRVPPFILGIWMYGLPGAFAGYFMGSLAVMLSNMMILHRTLSLGYGKLAGQMVRPVVCVAVMALALYMAQAWLPQASAGAGAAAAALGMKIVIGIAACGAARLAFSKISGRRELLDIKTDEALEAAAAKLRAMSVFSSGKASP